MRISKTYLDLNRQLHRTNPDFGRAAHAAAPWIAQLATESGVRSLLDYGCGKGTLRPAVLALAPNLIIAEYDPAMPGKDMVPDPCDLVVCVDVLEHVEPECLSDVLEHIQELGLGGAVFIIDTGPAQKTLADGRNAHLIVEGLDWWKASIADYFDIQFAEPLAPPPEPRIALVGVRKK